MVAVFKTNITHPADANKIINKLLGAHPNFTISIDLEDEDRILRVEGDCFDIVEICAMIERKHFICMHLPIDFNH